MEAESFNSNHLLGSPNRLLPAVVPVLLISIGYVDPGKWAATVEGGARFGSDLVVLMLVFNFAAILCQYLSARIGLVTGKDLAQQYQGSTNISKDALCHNHFVAILCVFSGIYLVNYVLMVSAANVFNSTGLVVLTFQEAISLMEQVFRIPIAPFAYLLVLFFSNQITSLTWSLSGRVVLQDFLKLDIPIWLHCATIRVIAVVPALYCVWSSGSDGMYQLLILTQVIVALLLPSSVIPLFRVAASRSIMGVYKISQFVEFLALITFIGMLGLKLMFVVEMAFGNSDWVGNLRWNMGSSMSFSYIVLLFTACASLCLMLWLLATPLKSASAKLDAQVWNWDTPKAVPDPSTEREETDLTGAGYYGEASVQMQEPSPAEGKGLQSHSDIPVADLDHNLPETIMEPDQELHLTTVEENRSNATFPSSPTFGLEESGTTGESVPVSTVSSEVSDVKLLDSGTVKTGSMDPVENVEIEGDLQTEKDDDEGDTWEAEESSKGVSGSTQSLTSEGPGSFRSLSGKGDEGGSGAGSLSRLAGLGRAARRQLAQVLDEFWGQLYDFHGQATQEAKAKKLDVLLGVDSKLASSSLKVDITTKEISGYLPSVGGRGSDHLINSSLYDSPKQQNVQRSLESLYGVQRGSSSLWSNPVQLLGAYVQNSSHNVIDSSERPYSSVRNLQPSESWDYQPATVHGYQIASYRMAKDRSSDHLNNPMESSALRSPSLGVTNYRDSIAFSSRQKLHNGLSFGQASGLPNPAISRDSPLHSERSYYDFCTSGPAEIYSSSGNTKKYHSLPDMSGLSIPQRDLYISDKSSQWDSAGGYGSSVARTGYEPSLYPNFGSRTGAPLAFDELSPSKAYRDGFSSQWNSDTGSLWSRQPFEQFGVADKYRTVGSEGVGSRASSITQEATSVVDSEAKLLQSFRHCIVKLLKLEGSDWLFRQNDGADEDLIDRVAAREKLLYEAETREMNRSVHLGEPQYLSSDRKSASTMRNNDATFNNFLIYSVPHCGEGCIWRSDLIVSFGVWCIHRVLDLSLMESRPELWGKYTYVLNRLQGIVDVAFSKPRSPMTPCFCLEIPTNFQQKSSPPPVSNGMLPPASKPGRGKCTTAAVLLDIIKDVEIAISCRKGRTGTAAGDVAFPKGKENLASVLKRYKRRLSNKPVGAHEGSALRKVPTSAPYTS
ncbi:ethylene-insensitive protein 2.1 isoform X2 [Corylus avellana]|uniref:ethylene-insensitive protein 2.1 isoform X2 n=1 Tax=Corylus avellana TaxID=13451 RepID=UPI00286A4CA2|nr:ethylene-insensitive protein 2.1 isoform X2 [Corylus avellana]